jgi:hypothetical protein
LPTLAITRLPVSIALTLLTMLAGPHRHSQYDVDLFLHSLTRFVSGPGDVRRRSHYRAADRTMQADFSALGAP